MVQFSALAKAEILHSLALPEIAEKYALRVGLKGSACSAEYILGFDKPTENDMIYWVDDIKVLIDKSHLMYLIGVKIDLEQTDEGFGFTIKKP